MFLYTTGFVEISIVKLLILDSGMEVIFVIDIDLDDVNEVAIYEAFNVDGNESEALNDSYLELFELIGRDAMLKLFKYFRGDKIDCPMRLYRPEFIADLAKQTNDRRERAKIARAGGYTAKFIEGVLHKRRDEDEAE
jgi:hypothetical protein